MNTLDQLGILLADLPVYLANGLLIVLYALFGNLAALLSASCAGLVGWRFDPPARQAAGFVPLRTGAFNPTHMPNRATSLGWIMTGAAFGLWLVAQALIREPVAWIGAGMWGLGVIAISLTEGHQRDNTLWFVKSGLILYSLAVIASRVYLNYTAQLSPEQWAGLLGSTDTAAAVIANTRSNVTTIVLWAIWLVIPLGYFSMLIQQLLVMPRSLLNPKGSAQQTMQNTFNRR
jgi:hypothetical protein